MIPTRGRISDLWERMRDSYWFVPSVLIVAALSLAVALIRLDFALNTANIATGIWFDALGAEAARTILATIAGGMTSVAGVVFSITVVALQLASSQFGPRLLRNFMTDFGNQLVLGIFVATIVYCLTVLATIRNDSFVPHVATATGFAIGLVDLAVLVYFIHHIAASIRVETVIAMAVARLHDTTDDLFPRQIGQEDGQAGDPRPGGEDEGADGPHGVVCAEQSGYIRRLDPAPLMEIAIEGDLVLRLECEPGDFVAAGDPLVLVSPPEGLDSTVERRIRQGFVIGPQRTPTQDIDFALRQLVEMALRALSPGINDPYTAIECIDRLGEGLGRLAERQIPAPHRFDDQGKLRVVAQPVVMRKIAASTLWPVARAGGANPDIVVRLIRAVMAAARHCRDRDDCQAMSELAEAIAVESLERQQSASGRVQIERCRAAAASQPAPADAGQEPARPPTKA